MGIIAIYPPERAWAQEAWEAREPSEPELERVPHSGSGERVPSGTWYTCGSRDGSWKGSPWLLGCGTLHTAGGAGLPLSGIHCHLAVVMDGGPQGEAGDGSHPRVLKGTIRAKPNLLEAEENVEQAGHPYTCARGHSLTPATVPGGVRKPSSVDIVAPRLSPVRLRGTDGAGGAGSHPSFLGLGLTPPLMGHGSSSPVVVVVDDVSWPEK